MNIKCTQQSKGNRGNKKKRIGYFLRLAPEKTEHAQSVPFFALVRGCLGKKYG